MATLKEHQAAMVDLLANGSAIPASASRLAHAMHDVLSAILSEPDLITKAVSEAAQLSQDATTPGLNDKALSKPQKALKTDSPAKWPGAAVKPPVSAENRVKELENTIRQLKANLVHERACVAELNGFLESAKKTETKLRKALDCAEHEIMCLKVAINVPLPPPPGSTGCQTLDDHAFPKTENGVAPCARCGVSEASALEQAGCRKEDTQVCLHEWVSWSGGDCPVPWGALVEVELRSDDFGGCAPERADFYRWEHDGSYDDVIRYRTVGFSK